MLSKNEKPVEESNDKPPTIQQDLTMDEKIALEVYEAMKSKKKSKNDRIEDENDDLGDDEPMETNENEGLLLDIVLLISIFFLLFLHMYLITFCQLFVYFFLFQTRKTNQKKEELSPIKFKRTKDYNQNVAN